MVKRNKCCMCLKLHIDTDDNLLHLWRVLLNKLQNVIIDVERNRSVLKTRFDAWRLDDGFTPIVFCFSSIRGPQRRFVLFSSRRRPDVTTSGHRDRAATRERRTNVPAATALGVWNLSNEWSAYIMFVRYKVYNFMRCAACRSGLRWRGGERRTEIIYIIIIVVVTVAL